MNILHLALDEKFILFFDSVFSRLPDVKNRYVVHVDRDAPLKHVGSLDAWRVVGNRYFFSRAMTEDLAWADCLIVHYLHAGGARMLLRAPSRVAKVWSGWGADYYGFMPGGERALLGDETAKLMVELASTRRTLSQRMVALAYRAKNLILERLFILPAVHRVDYFSSPIRNDFDLLQLALGEKFRAEYAQLNYGSVEQTFSAAEGRCHGDNILIGNSATPTNNHLEAFRLLAKQDLSGRKVIVPLSYGLPEYREAVIEQGRAIFGDHFVPLRDYLPLPDYAKLIAQCSVVIMNHRRQQALGNIGAMLYSGAKVFLEERSPVYVFLKKRGAHLHPTALLGKPNGELFVPLDDEQITENRRILFSVWGQDQINKNAEALLSRIELHSAKCA